MAQQVYIKVVGFTDVERHALKTLFQLSEERPTALMLWKDDTPAAPQILLLDGQMPDAWAEAEQPHNQQLRLVWIGDNAPSTAWQTFARPVAWPDVVEAIDAEYAATQPGEEIDFDLGGDGDDAQATLPPDEVPADEPPARLALIASPSLDERLYLRAKLALNHFTIADEAETAAQVRELLGKRSYMLALVDFGLTDGEGGWPLIRQMTKSDKPIPHVIVTKQDATVPERVRGWLAGVDALLPKPADPLKLEELLRKVN